MSNEHSLLFADVFHVRAISQWRMYLCIPVDISRETLCKLLVGMNLGPPILNLQKAIHMT